VQNLTRGFVNRWSGVQISHPAPMKSNNSKGHP
jgi:hypothetical protein